MNGHTHAGHRRHLQARRARVGAWITCVLVAAWATAAESQERAPTTVPADTLVEVVLDDGTELVGRVVDRTADALTLETVGGLRVEVERRRIREARVAQGRVHEGVYWPPDPNTSRLFFGATARPLPAGGAYVGTYFLVLPFVAAGVTDRITIAAGAPVLAGEFEPFYVAPKVLLVEAPGLALSVGSLHLFFQDETAGIVYGVGTLGDEDHALHAGLGWGFSGDDITDEPLGMVGVEARAGRRLKVLGEVYFIPGGTGTVFIGGVRLVGRRLSTDVGMAGVVGDESGGACCLPVVNFSYAFGRR